MRQILYISVSTAPAGKADLAAILEQSRHNNAIDGVTGLLWSDGTHFMQVIEGPATSVEATFGRIILDSRHRDVETLHDRPIEARGFGSWSMILKRAGDPVDVYDAKMRRLLSNASDGISERFRRLIATSAADARD
ncbi:BLUF domain-containing protein [Sphingomonas sp. So64.6b]|uniref:BLUF domain-containing protein n=1 Tax=Sphingomonas sp. So64.6b TaxID=2997354 RepID=UPI001602E4B0|nr:BLUF domain-containing protein [Sphingomonas sp. So64.6b]QNA83888.1 BLUF domain-containing protein [Sphingomonas sp. So64.6b]